VPLDLSLIGVHVIPPARNLTTGRNKASDIRRGIGKDDPGGPQKQKKRSW